MIKFKIEGNNIILSYSSNQPSPRWVYDGLNTLEEVKISKVFIVTKNILVSVLDIDNEHAPIEFKIGVRKDNYYYFKKNILSLNHDLYIHKDIKLERRIFIAERGISIFVKIDSLGNEDIYIGGDKEGSIPETIFKDLLKKFPNTYELNKYSSARISSVLSSYIDTKEDYEEKYQKYLNKKISRKGTNLRLIYSEFELDKYTSILEKLNYMLLNETSYNEAQWQKEILQIILLLYPKYIHVFEEAPVRDTYKNTTRSIDYLLIDASGNTDIVEIKKPFDKCIVTKNTYRDNYIPLRELSGTVMQIEKYIFYLNKWGIKGEKYLTNYFKTHLTKNFKIKITNPSALIIMGRTRGMTTDQVQDFEVIKRKYKNVIDIITYDDLIERLKFTIQQWKDTANIT